MKRTQMGYKHIKNMLKDHDLDSATIEDISAV